MNNELPRRAAIVGASSGIGRATALGLAVERYDVLAVGRDQRKLDDLHDLCRREGLHNLTVRKADAGDRTLDPVLEEFAPLGHIVLCLSSALGGGPFAQLNLDDLRAGFEGKFWPYLAALRAALPHLGHGSSVTLVTGASAGASIPGTAGLAAINGALEAMIPILAVDLPQVRVNAISPGVIDTPWWSGFPPEARAQMFADYADAAPARRIGRAEDVAHAIQFVIENSFVTGATIHVDGGLRLA